MTVKSKPDSLIELKHKRKKVRDLHQNVQSQVSRLDRLALAITQSVGSSGFFLCIALWTLLWLGWNLLAPPRLQFDPPMGFVFWLFISNLIQILLMPLIMIGQTLQGRHAEIRAENDLNINIKAEEEIELVLQHLEYQNDLLVSVLEKLDHASSQANPSK